MKSKITSMLFLLLFSVLTAAAQSYALRGTVTDKAGEPLTGVSILIKGTSTGTQTDIDGNFTLNVKNGNVLRASYIGYRPYETKINGQKEIAIVLEEDSQVLDEVVVTALGIKREQKALSYNVQTVNSDALNGNKSANFMNSLAGKVAGVNINAGAAGPGSSTRVVMRGVKSLANNDNALYVIDGIPMFDINSGSESGSTMNKQPGTSTVADLNPEDIESLSVLSGPSAAALYGSEAAGGVILINTKKGKAGKTKVSYSNTTQFQNAWMTPKFQNTYGNNPGDFESWGPKLDTPSSYNPLDFFRTGVTEINSLTVTAGNDINQTFASVAITNAPGVMLNSDYNRYNFSVNNTTALAKNLSLNIGASYIMQNNKNLVATGQYYNPIPALWLFPRGEDFDDIRMYERFDPARNIYTQYWEQKYPSPLDVQNPYWTQNRQNRENRKYRYMYNASLKYDITDYLYVTGRVRVDNMNSVYEEKFNATNSRVLGGYAKGSYTKALTNDRSSYADVLASFNKNFIDNRLNINAQVGASVNDQIQESQSYGGSLNIIPNFFAYGNIKKDETKVFDAEWHDQTQSIFASAAFGWDSQYYLTVTGRNDWASPLAFTSTPSYFYPSIGGSWVISQTLRDFLPQQITYLKVFGSGAEVATSPNRYLTRMQYIYDDQTHQYKWPATHYNPDLRPENTRSYEFGLSSKFFDNTLGLEVTFYKSNTYNQTFTVMASTSSGYEKNLVQSGNIENRGIEASLTYRNVFGDLRFDTGLTYSINKNKIIRLANGVPDPETHELIQMEYYAASGCLGSAGGPAIRLYEGGTMGDIYSNRRLRQSANGYIWKDPKTGNVELETVDYFKVGSILPKFHMGWNGSLGYKDINLTWLVSGRFGGQCISDTQALMDQYGVSAATAAARDNGGVPIAGNGMADAKNYYQTIAAAPGTYYIYDATNVRLADLTIGYTLPKAWLRNVAQLTLSLTGKNLWMIYCKAPFDPETTVASANNFYQGVDFFNMPSMRTYGFNINLTF